MRPHIVPPTLDAASLSHSYKVPYILPSSVSSNPFICHSYANNRGGIGFFPFWHPSSQDAGDKSLPTNHGTRTVLLHRGQQPKLEWVFPTLTKNLGLRTNYSS